jgi:hypothetical protein
MASGVEPMGANQSRSSDRVASEVVVLANLREWRERFNENPLDPEAITQGLVTLSEIGESALVQAVRYGQKVEEVHESQQQVKGQLEIVQGKLDTVISKFESSSAVRDNESESVAEELKGLHRGVQEVRDMSQALLDHFSITLPNKSPA